MRLHIVLAGRDLTLLSTLAVQLNDSEFTKTLVEAERPVDQLLRELEPLDAAVLHFSGHENVGDLSALFRAYPDARFLFLSDAWPPSAAIAKLVARHRGAITRANAYSVIIISTLIALLTRRESGV